MVSLVIGGLDEPMHRAQQLVDSVNLIVIEFIKGIVRFCLIRTRRCR